MIPAADVSLSLETLGALLADQAPQFADLGLIPVAEGWDNLVFRLGDALAVRAPRRASAVRALEAEARWAEEAGWGLSLPIPVPVFQGQPGHGYPYPWLVTTYFPGTIAAELTLEQRDSYAEQLAGFLVGLHLLAPLNAPANEFRGVPVEDVWSAWESALEHVPEPARTELREDMLLARKAAPWQGAARWIHGDPHPLNLVATPRGDEARLVAAIDLSDLTSGDPASDVGLAQTQFSPEGARRFRAAYGRGAFWADGDLWDRAAGWRARFLALMHDDAGPLGRVARESLGWDKQADTAR